MTQTIKSTIILLIILTLSINHCNNNDQSLSNKKQKKLSNHNPHPKNDLIESKYKTLTQQISHGKNIMIASDNDLATQAGLEVHKQGGNIVDVAIAVSFAISVTRPQSTGIGGGGFMLLHLSKNNQTISYDFRERAPSLAYEKMFIKKNGELDRQAIQWGYQSVGVPGIIAGLLDIHKKYGSLPLNKVMEPAINLSEKGFKVYPMLANAISEGYSNMDESMKKIFAPNGNPLKTGDFLIQKDLAKSLKLISKDGKKAFYSGAIAHALNKVMKKLKGYITLSDLKNYNVYQQTPLWTKYRNHPIAIMPPPSSGIHIVTMLNILEKKNINKMNRNHPLYNHFLIEVMRRGFADRTKFGGDPRFIKIPIKDITSKSYAQKYYTGINLKTATKSSALSHLSDQQHESPNTTHISIIDSEGNAISTTQSINYLFGARVMIPGWGIVLNNTMDDFSAAPGKPNLYGLIGGKANAIQGNKTPLSSMSPTIVFKPSDNPQNHKPILVLGASGGSMIITAILQTLIHTIDFNYDLYKSLAIRRLHHQFTPDGTILETSALSDETVNLLRKMGHQIIFWKIRSRVCAVQNKNGELIGVSDPRGDGEPGGN